MKNIDISQLYSERIITLNEYFNIIYKFMPNLKKVDSFFDDYSVVYDAMLYLKTLGEIEKVPNKLLNSVLDRNISALKKVPNFVALRMLESKENLENKEISNKKIYQDFVVEKENVTSYVNMINNSIENSSQAALNIDFRLFSSKIFAKTKIIEEKLKENYSTTEALMSVNLFDVNAEKKK